MEPSTSSVQKVRSQRDAGIQTVIGFEDDARRLVEQLTGGKKQLQFISVVGMAGLGKTTLVRKVFDELSIVKHFFVRAWTTVTQEPKKRDLVLGILKSGFNAGTEDMSDMELSVTLKRRLSGQRYLVVMDDIWDSKDWNDLMLCFPDENVGSRIVFTSRLTDVPQQVQPGCYQHHLRFLTDKESCDLLCYKVFLNESCPPLLFEIGKQVAKKCHGLPLSIVVMAQILANDTTTAWWSQVAQDMRSIASNAPEEYMDILLLSYNHLPDHLKPCFLYFAAFPEDYEIPAWKLILLWVAEGFIKIQTGENNSEDEGNNLEEVAAQYLKDLITRSLVIVSKRRSNGGIKSCIVHDALRDLCITKANEVKFLDQIPTFYKDKKLYQHFVSKVETPTTCLVQRLYSREVDGDNFIRQLIRYFHVETPSTPMVNTPKGINRIFFILPRAFKRIKYIFRKSLYPNVRTILAYNGSGNSFVKVSHTKCYLFDVLRVFKLLTVIDLSCIGLSSIPVVIESLLQLRYIALYLKADNDNSVDRSILSGRATSVSKLKHLETFVLHSEKNETTSLPNGILELYRLRHLILKGKLCIQLYDLQTLSHLQTLSLPIFLGGCEKILEVTPNLRKLGINSGLYLSSPTLMISNLAKLQYLESLSLQNNLDWGYSDELPLGLLSSQSRDPFDKIFYRELSSPRMFPLTLKNLTLVRTFLKWDEMQKIGMLPNLEVLKLQCEAFRGDHWETTDGGFCCLKYLSLKFMKIVRWIAYSEQFPNLQHLKLDECEQLEEIPISIGDIYTLEMIEIRNCNPAVVQSARIIKQDQMNKRNDLLKVSIYQA